MRVNISDIRKRTNYNATTKYTDSIFNINEMNLYTNKYFVYNNAKYMLEHWLDFNSNTNIAYARSLDVFDEICENCNPSQIRDCCAILLEGVNKVRDANQLMNAIKHRTSRFKTKISTKINNSIDAINGANSASLNNISNKIHSAISSLPGAGSAQPNSDTSGVAQECYNILLSEAQLVEQCDRILRNYNKISKRFNFDRMVTEVSNDKLIYDCIVEMCECIDTYDINFKNKYNTALENTYYILNKNYMNYPNDKIIEAVTDYFVINNTITEDTISDIDCVKNNSVIFSESDFSCIDYLFPQDLVTESKTLSAEDYGVDFETLDEGALKNKVKEWSKGNPEEHKNDNVKKMIDEFRESCKDKKPENTIINLKGLVNKIYTKSPEEIVDSTPKVLTIIRAFFIIGGAAINPVIGVVNFIADKALHINLERKQLIKLINCYKKEIDLVNTKIDKSNTDSSKDRLEKYKAALKTDLNKLKEYEDDLYSENENEKRHEDDYEFDDDFDLGMDDDEWNFDESQYINISTVCLISELVQGINEALLDNDIDGIVYNNIFKFNNDTLDAITDFSITVPVILEKNKLKEALTENRNQLRSLQTKSVDDLIRIDCINQNLYKLEASRNTYNVTNDTKGIICTLNWLNEMATSSNSEYVLEMDFSNTLKLAMNRLKKTVVNLSNKEKQLSNTIDISMRNVSKGLENAMMNDNREAVIRGSILPSASKTIKIAITTGAAWAINPAIAVIGAIGAFACSKKLKAKERQLVLDDIEIELKMCERYLRNAEEKNDMKAIRQIEITQRNLQRQQQRIKYKMNVVYNQKVPDIKSNDD